MKARVKATGDIVEATLIHEDNGKLWYDIDKSGHCLTDEELDFHFERESDYWEKLKHQYAGMAMQGIVMNEKMQYDLYQAFGKNESMDVTISEFAIDIANTIVKKLKEESKL